MTLEELLQFTQVLEEAMYYAKQFVAVMIADLTITNQYYTYLKI